MRAKCLFSPVQNGRKPSNHRRRLYESCHHEHSIREIPDQPHSAQKRLADQAANGRKLTGVECLVSHTV